MFPSHLVCWLGSPGVFLRTEPAVSSSVSSPEVNEGLGSTGSGSGKVSSLLFSRICESVYFSQLKKKKDWAHKSTPLLKKCERKNSQSQNSNSSGIKLDWEPKFKRKLGHVIKRPNGEQRERPVISVPSTHRCPCCSCQWLWSQPTLLKV